MAEVNGHGDAIGSWRKWPSGNGRIYARAGVCPTYGVVAPVVVGRRWKCPVCGTFIRKQGSNLLFPVARGPREQHPTFQPPGCLELVERLLRTKFISGALEMDVANF